MSSPVKMHDYYHYCVSPSPHHHNHNNNPHNPHYPIQHEYSRCNIDMRPSLDFSARGSVYGPPTEGYAHSPFPASPQNMPSCMYSASPTVVGQSLLIKSSEQFLSPSSKENGLFRDSPGCRRRLDFNHNDYIDLSKAVPVTVAKRNERERNRVKLINTTFQTLRQHLPVQNRGAKGQAKKLSKVQTLRSAIDYIRRLEDLVEERKARRAAGGRGVGGGGEGKGDHCKINNNNNNNNNNNDDNNNNNDDNDDIDVSGNGDILNMDRSGVVKREIGVIGIGGGNNDNDNMSVMEMDHEDEEDYDYDDHLHDDIKKGSNYASSEGSAAAAVAAAFYKVAGVTSPCDDRRTSEDILQGRSHAHFVYSHAPCDGSGRSSSYPRPDQSRYPTGGRSQASEGGSASPVTSDLSVDDRVPANEEDEFFDFDLWF